MLPEEARHWAVGALGGGRAVVSATGLREGANPWLLRFEPADRLEAAVLRLGDPADPGDRRRFGTEVAALRLAGRHRLPAARLIAVDPDGSSAGALAILTTVLPGHSRIPRVASAERLRRLGATAAALSAIPVRPRLELPLRTRSIADVDFAARRRARGSTALLDAAQERLGQLAEPAGPTVFVHGDLWHGNTLWSGDRLTGLVDWDCAGAGAPGIDLGGVRFDAALNFGLPAAEQVLHGWQRATGGQAHRLAYWDLVAACCSLADMAYTLPVLRDQGRDDPDAATLGRRRDAFLEAALAGCG